MQTGNHNIRLSSLIAGIALTAILLVCPPVANAQGIEAAMPRSPSPSVPTDFNFAGPIAATVEPPRNDQRTYIPLQHNAAMAEVVQVDARTQTVSIFARGVDIRLVLGHLADESQVNIVVAENVNATVTTTLTDVPLWEALDAILRINGLVWSRQGNIIFVTSPGLGGQQAQVSVSPGLQLQVFDLNYTAASEVLEVVRGLLSTGGRAFMHEVDKQSTRQTRERIVVEDFPDRLEAIRGYLNSIDNAPQQVLLEAHVLQVTLGNDRRHGVNLAALARVSGARIDVRAAGFANGDLRPGFMVGLDGNDLDTMIEALCSDSNVRTLAAPKVMVVNGQMARIQIGSKFGYFVTTATQTAALQSVDFLDIGVVLQVQPTITRDGQVLLTVEPKVSGGRINPNSGLPEEETTEANTTVLLADGQGMIIGGLIKESDEQESTWAPWLGKQPVLKHFFSRHSSSTKRVEVILALTAHILPGLGTPCADPQLIGDSINPRDELFQASPANSYYAPAPYSAGSELQLIP